VRLQRLQQVRVEGRGCFRGVDGAHWAVQGNGRAGAGALFAAGRA
jgi:hypothetical protein